MKPHQRQWMKHNGPIPTGKHIHHIDGDHFNNDIKNLICVSREMHAAIHKKQFEEQGNPKDAYAYNRLTMEPKISGFKRRGGWRLSEETKKRMSEAKKGKVPYERTDETKKKMSEAATGRVLSEETKKKMSESKKGENHPMFGKKHSPETLEKLRKNKSAIIKEWWRKRKNK